MLPDVQLQMPSKRTLHDPSSCFSLFCLFVFICGLDDGRDVKVAKLGKCLMITYRDIMVTHYVYDSTERTIYTVNCRDTVSYPDGIIPGAFLKFRIKYSYCLHRVAEGDRQSCPRLRSPR